MEVATLRVGAIKIMTINEIFRGNVLTDITNAKMKGKQDRFDL